MKIYNTLTRKKEEFVPITPGKVKMYSCGPTVYNYFHIGNARPFIIFDTLRRYLEYIGYDVTFVQNFTDIDDKMIKNANEQGITVKELADKFIAEYFKDAKGLGIKEATIHPKATENMDAIISTVNTLVDKGYAYESNGDVYFETKKFSEYGKLSKQPLEDLEAGARIDVTDVKRNPTDFALWKAKKEGEPAWESPWGEGRPGWHIECSAMVNKFLGETIDIHSGGQDLIFPHHENEIAQSECANGKPFARYWMHNGYINVDNEKMSKSKGNFFTVRDVAKKYDYEVIRFFMLSAHYRSVINFADELLAQSKSGLDRLYNCLYNLEFLTEKSKKRPLTPEEETAKTEILSFKDKFCAAMDDDLNTADAIAALFDLVKYLNSANKEAWPKELYDVSIGLMRELGGVLGIFHRQQEDTISERAKELIEQRKEARAQKDWAKADEIRDELLSLGIEVADTRQGMKIRILEK
ncbi:MAG TPA: cysteine--tRNA ligase [Clostridiales bacterium]|nr:cysteine--tRNA ligase [Clostridiales bacterium]HBL81366.1 cysteine--tRNA ligase [Clostridiales bacterium]